MRRLTLNQATQWSLQMWTNASTNILPPQSKFLFSLQHKLADVVKHSKLLTRQAA